jgi:hypothetical protein
MIDSDGGGGDCGGVGGEVFCGPPVPVADDAAIVAAAPAEAGVAYVGNYRVSRDGIVHVGGRTGKKPETDAQD